MSIFSTTKKTMALAVALFFSVVAMAQSTGTVVNKDGAPIPKVTISSGGNVVGMTDAQGRFSVNVSSGKLKFTSTGYEAVTVDAGSNLTVTMSTAVSAGENVVVVGYGTRRVKDATGSVAAITPKDFNKGQISTPEQLFQGRTPGVIISPSSGEPGAAASINIRGSAAIRGNQEPLYVVDGVPLDGGATTGTNSGVEGSSTPKNPLMFINPNDIESINILKDASSAAIYGARGANGVIIITTKNGRGSRGSFNFGLNTSIAKPASRYDLLNRNDFLRGVYTMNVLAGTPPAAAAVAVASNDRGSETDWQDQIFRTAISQNVNLGWGFARNKTSLRLSGSYDNQNGIIKKSALKRLTGRANFSKTFLSNDRLRLDATVTATNTKNSYVANTNNAGYLGSLIGATIKYNPTAPIKDPLTGKFYDMGDGSRNPVQLLEHLDDNDNVNRFLSNLSLSYKIKNGLVFKTTLGIDNAGSVRISTADPRFANAGAGTTVVFGVDYGNSIAGNGRGYKNVGKTRGTLFENTLTYDKAFGTRHNLNAVLGQSYQSSQYEYEGTVYWKTPNTVSAATDVFNKDLNSFINKKPAYVPVWGKSELSSFFGRVNYTLDDKYLLTATLRADGSSKFGKNNRWGVFPAFAAKWKVLNEKFAGGLNKVFGDFSIRANWGQLGSQDGLDAYSAVELSETYFTNFAGTTTGTKLIHQANDKLRWETATTTGIGLDWETKNKRLSGTVDYYVTKRDNLIFYGPTPGGFAPVANYFYNLPGYVYNSGLEFSLNYAIIKGRKFNWSTSYNMTFFKNEMRDFPLPVITGAVSGQGLSGAYAQTITNNQPLFSWKMPVFDGFDNVGNAKYLNGGADQIVGSALPKFNAGFTNNFSYDRWSASLFFNATTGFMVYNNTANALFLTGSLKNGANVDYRTVRSLENPINPGAVSTRFLEKGDFLRLANAQLSYDFNIKNKKLFKSVTATLSGQNLWLLTNYTGLDPEVNVDKNINGTPSRGFDYAGYPKARVWTIGVNVGF